MRTTITLPDSVFRSAKKAAEAQGITLSALVEAALQVQLNSVAVTRTRCVKLPVFQGKLVDPNIDLDRTSAILIAE